MLLRYCMVLMVSCPRSSDHKNKYFLSRYTSRLRVEIVGVVLASVCRFCEQVMRRVLELC